MARRSDSEVAHWVKKRMEVADLHTWARGVGTLFLLSLHLVDQQGRSLDVSVSSMRAYRVNMVSDT